MFRSRWFRILGPLMALFVLFAAMTGCDYSATEANGHKSSARAYLVDGEDFKVEVKVQNTGYASHGGRFVKIGNDEGYPVVQVLLDDASERTVTLDLDGEGPSTRITILWYEFPGSSCNSCYVAHHPHDVSAPEA